MTKKEWLALPLPETPLVLNKKYRGSKVTWANGKTAFFHVMYN